MKWKRPEPAWTHYWRSTGLPAAREFFNAWSKWSLLLGLPSVAAVWWVGSEQLITVCVVILTMVAVPLVSRRFLGFQPRIRERWPETYSLDERGVRTGGGRVGWKSVEAAAIEDHPDVEGVRRLVLHVRGNRFPTVLEFDPAELDEDALAETLSARVHSRVLLRPAAPATASGSLLRAASSAGETDRALLLRQSDKE